MFLFSISIYNYNKPSFTDLLEQWASNTGNYCGLWKNIATIYIKIKMMNIIFLICYYPAFLLKVNYIVIIYTASLLHNATKLQITGYTIA